MRCVHTLDDHLSSKFPLSLIPNVIKQSAAICAPTEYNVELLYATGQHPAVDQSVQLLVNTTMVQYQLSEKNVVIHLLCHPVFELALPASLLLQDSCRVAHTCFNRIHVENFRSTEMWLLSSSNPLESRASNAEPKISASSSTKRSRNATTPVPDRFLK